MILENYIKEVLLFENVVVNNKIANIINRLSKSGEVVDILVESISGSSGFSVRINIKGNNVAYINFMLADRLERKGKETRKWVVGVDEKGVKLSKKRRAYQVGNSRAEKGFGPLVYEIGLEVISSLLMQPGALLSDRRTVSQDAKGVWDKFLERSKIESNLHSVKMDIDQKSIKSAKEDPGIEVSQMTPDFEEDDLKQMSSLDYLSKSDKEINWKDVEISLSYAFFKDDLSIIKLLNKNKNFNLSFNLD